MPLHKTHKSVADQKIILEKRGIVVDDISILERINYSHLIYEYGSFYEVSQNNGEPTYKQGTKLSHVNNLMEFNNKIGSYLFLFFADYEHYLKSAIASVLSKVDSCEYLQQNAYCIWHPSVTQKEIDDFWQSLIKINNDNKSNYDPKYLVNGDMPIWILVDHLAIGQLRMLLKLSIHKNDLYAKLNMKQNEWRKLKHFNAVRNRLFHFNRFLIDSIQYNNDNFWLSDFFKFLKLNSPKTFSLIDDLIKNTDFMTNFNIDRGQFLKKLYIFNHFPYS